MDLFGDYFYGGKEGFMKNFNAPMNMSRAIIYISIFTTYAVNFFAICPNTLGKKQYFQFGLGIVFLIVVFAGVRYLLEEVILFHFTGEHNYYEVSRTFFFYTFDNSYYAVKGILYSTLLYVFFLYVGNQNRVHILELDYKSAELSFLKSQLEPHFLFNTLNTFYTDLIDTQPNVAKDIHRLSELLRYVTYEAENELMPLEKELKFIEDYIYLHRKRFEDTLFLEYKVEGYVGNQIVPSLVFIHFIENIFKHGITNQKQHPAKMSIIIASEQIIIETENWISSSEKYNNAGIGKDNLSRRLTAIYKDQYELIYKEDENTFKAFLKIPIQPTL